MLRCVYIINPGIHETSHCQYLFKIIHGLQNFINAIKTDILKLYIRKEQQTGKDKPG